MFKKIFFLARRMAKTYKTKFQLEVVNLVKEIRTKKGFSQDDIAFFLNVTRGYIGQIESINSSSKYTLDQLNILAFEMKCSPKDFIPEHAIEKNIPVNIKKSSRK
jgi:transcriptional regulator with XRE-family HTH domain